MGGSVLIFVVVVVILLLLLSSLSLAYNLQLKESEIPKAAGIVLEPYRKKKEAPKTTGNPGPHPLPPIPLPDIHTAPCLSTPNPPPVHRLNATDCVFENNQADFPEAEYDIGTEQLEGGGAVMLEDSANATFLSCNFSLNGGAVREGGGGGFSFGAVFSLFFVCVALFVSPSVLYFFVFFRFWGLCCLPTSGLMCRCLLSCRQGHPRIE